MSNIASFLKQEITRVARKELRAHVEPLKKLNAHYRKEIAQLKRQVQTLERDIRQLVKSQAKAAPPEPEAAPSTSHRFSAKGFASQRQRLGLSAAQMAQLLGASALSVYKWESGKVQPRAKQLEAIASLRGIGKREVAARLAGDTEAP